MVPVADWLDYITMRVSWTHACVSRYTQCNNTLRNSEAKLKEEEKFNRYMHKHISSYKVPYNTCNDIGHWERNKINQDSMTDSLYNQYYRNKETNPKASKLEGR